MTESERLFDLFGNLYDGHPWIDVTLVGVLQDIPAGQAHKRVLNNCNTIWEIVNHLIQWRKNVLQRVQGMTIKTPGNNYFVPVQDSSETAWKNTLSELENTQSQWMDFLQQLKTDQLEHEYPVNQMTYYEHIQGIIQHDAYHLGQIVLLAKL
jgi:uncharacterized damage-inducible protein DinB